MRLTTRLAALAVTTFAASLTAVPVALAADEPPPIEEDYAYPGADRIYAEKGIRLKRGDGRIVLVDCVNGADQLEVWARNKPKFCFTVSGAPGWVTLELPQVYLIKGESHNVDAVVQVAGKPTADTLRLKKSEWNPIGEGSSTSDATLLEFRAVP
ncbi:hypothetical protein JOF53_006382 [Crossiella equi]|uniref:Secreted protein n=1 Tax=Crossiella equi TaxID=130796 RepID=A0ABS5ALR8_9PSEU|nr:hypothetical protein [Crossiella equi]MBP2477510.1 hypothetical protein [Crossiella equi]